MTNPLPASYSRAKTTSVPLKIGNKTGIFTFTLFKIVLEVLATTMKQKEEIKSILIRKKEVKVSLFADDMILYLDNAKDSTKKLLELIHEFSKVAGYKINIQKPVAFSYANNKLTEKEIKKTIPFTIASKRIKYLGINPTNFLQYLKDL